MGNSMFEFLAVDDNLRYHTNKNIGNILQVHISVAMAMSKNDGVHLEFTVA